VTSSKPGSSRNEATVSTLIRPLVFLSFYLALAAVAFRGFNIYFLQDHELRWIAAGLLLAFFVLSVSCYWLTRRLWWFPHLYMTLQAGLVLGLLIIPPYQDFWALLYFLLSAEAMLLFSQRTGYLWLGIFALAMAGALVYTTGWRNGLPMILLYGTGFYFFGSFATLMARAEADKAELQEAQRLLHERATQAEELAVAQERNRLARDLHDSVTQSIFTITLTAEAAQILLEKEPAKVTVQLARIQELAQGALAEMRSLISQLRPTNASEAGLATAIHKHLATLRSQYGLAVEFQQEGDGQLSREQEQGLFRIVQEALNNVSKHAHTDKAVVTLRITDGRALLLVEDHGAGFCLSPGYSSEGHFGLSNMRERAELQGGTFKVESLPGEGTRITVDIPCVRRG
jgi:signal transduction histidine kinase